MSSLRSSIDSLVLFYVFVLCSTLRVCDHHSYCPKPFGSKSVSNYQRFLSFFSQSWIIWVIAGLYSDWSFGKPNAFYSAHLEILPLDEGWSTLGTAGKIWDLAKELPHGRFFLLGQSSPGKRFNKQKNRRWLKHGKNPSTLDLACKPNRSNTRFLGQILIMLVQISF